MLALPAGDPGVSSSRLAPPQMRHRPRLDPPYPPSFCRSGDWRRRRSTGRRRVHATWLRRRRGPGPGRAALRNLRLRLREALGHPAAGRGPHHHRPRRHRPGPVRDRQDLHDLPLRLPDRRHLRPRSAGIDTVAD